MYYISSLIGRASYAIFRAGNFITSPIRSLVYSIRSLARFNPLRLIRQSFYGIESQIRYILRLPNPSLSAKHPSLSSDVPRAQRTNRWRARSRARVSQRAQYSQIHLVRQSTGERTIVHIGTIIGRSTSEIIVDQPGHRPVQLRFSQVDPQQHKAPMILTYLAGEAAVRVGGLDLQQEAPLADNTAITIDDQDYTCQLYAWDKAPIVTRVDAGWATDTGPARQENQDAIGLYQHSDAYLFVIADGVGQGEYGAQISEFAVRYLLAAFHQNMTYSLNWQDVLTKAFKYANAEVRYFARHSPSAEGTTLTAVVIKGMEAHVAHVGDSRLYHWHQGTFRQVTTDHVEQMPTEQETRAANEATEPPQTRQVLSKAIGKANTIHPDVFTISLQPGDRLLFCTDGITGVIPADELLQIFGTMHAERLAGHLIQLAIDRETKDNVSAIAVDVLKDAFVEDAWLAENEPRIYAGFNRSWPLRLGRPRELYTSYPVTSRSGCWVALAVIMVIAIVFFALRSGRQDANTAIAPQTGNTPSSAQSASLTPTLTATPLTSPTPAALPATPTPTFPPTATRVRPTATPFVSPTPIPATSTLRASVFGISLPEVSV